MPPLRDSRPAAATLLLAVVAAMAHGAEPPGAGNDRPEFRLDTTLKWSGLASHAPDNPALFPDRWSGMGLFRGRLMPKVEIGDSLDAAR